MTSRRARSVRDNGSFQMTNLRISTRIPGFEKLGVNPRLGSNQGASSERSEPQRIYSPHTSFSRIRRTIISRGKS
jgi:hypothetical protein